MNGIRLQDAAPKVWITQAEETVDSLDVTTAVIPGWDGERPIRTARRSMRVKISAQIHEVRDLAARAAAFEAIAAWAGEGGILTLSNRPGRRLRVVTTSSPSLGKIRDYTQQVDIEFTAYAPPFWEDEYPITKAVSSAASGSVTFTVTGSHRTLLDVSATATGSLSSFSVTCGSSTIALTGLSVAANTPLILSHTDEDWLTIRAGTSSLLSKRTAASADDLILQPGANTVSWTASRAVALTLSTRGRYA